MRRLPTPPSVLLLLCVATAATTATVDAVRLRVVSFNIHAFRDAEHRDNLDALSELLNEVKPDVVCLNEVIHPWSSPPPDDPYWEEIRQRRGYGRVPPLGSVPLSPSSTHLYRLAQAIGMRHVVFGCASPEQSFFGRVPFGNAVLSRYELEDVVHGVMRADPDVDLHLGDQQRTLQDLEDRGVTTATVVLPGGRRLGVCVTHLDHKAEELREKQAQQVLSAARAAFATTASAQPPATAAAAAGAAGAAAAGAAAAGAAGAAAEVTGEAGEAEAAGGAAAGAAAAAEPSTPTAAAAADDAAAMPFFICGDLNSYDRRDMSDAQWDELCALCESKGWGPPRERSLVRAVLEDDGGLVDSFQLAPRRDEAVLGRGSGSAAKEEEKEGEEGGPPPSTAEGRAPPTCWTGARLDYLLLEGASGRARVEAHRTLRESTCSDHVPLVCDLLIH